MLGILPNSVSVRHDLAFQIRVHGLYSFHSAITLQLPHIFGSKQELSVQVALLNLIHVCNCDTALGPVPSPIIAQFLSISPYGSRTD
jgi:hypothetical protein